MQGCRRLSNSNPEVDGLDDLLRDPDQAMHDVSLEREERRTEQGYLTAGDARSFLQMARRPRASDANPWSSVNSIASAYFRALDDELEPVRRGARSDKHEAESSAGDPGSESIDALVGLLVEAGIAPAGPRALLGTGAADVPGLTPLQPLMEYIRDTNPNAYFLRSRELAFLANALAAGCSVSSRAFTIQEAWNAAIGVCNLGLEMCVDAEGAPDRATTPSDAFLVDHDLVTAFEAGWSRLYRDISVFCTERLIETLAALQNVDSETARDLYRLRRDLERNRDAGTPWVAAERLEVMATLDMPAWAALCGLLSECPVLPAALTAILEKHAGSVSATAFECFATGEQIRKVHRFLESLGDILRQ
jgi:hypothetical protein